MSATGNYGGTITGATAGFGFGAVVAYSGRKLVDMGANQMLKLKGASIAAKRQYISSFAPHKGTVSKLVKEAVETVKNPKVLAKCMAKYALVGAGIGLAVDLIRNAVSKKEK